MQLLPRKVTNMLFALALVVSPALKADTFSLHIGFGGYSPYPGYYQGYWPGGYWYDNWPYYTFPAAYGNYYPFYYFYYPRYYYPSYYYSIFYPPVFPFYYGFYYPWYSNTWYTNPYYRHHHYPYYSYSHYRNHEQYKHHGTHRQQAVGPHQTGYYRLGDDNRTQVITSRISPPSNKTAGGFATTAATGTRAVISAQYGKNAVPASSTTVVAPAPVPRTIRIISSGRSTKPLTFATARSGARNTVTFNNTPATAGVYADTSHRRQATPRFYNGTSMSRMPLPTSHANSNVAGIAARPAPVIPRQYKNTGTQSRAVAQRDYQSRKNQQQASQARRGPADPPPGRLVSAAERQPPVIQQNSRTRGTENPVNPRARGKSNNNQQQSGPARRGGYGRP